MKSKFKGFRGIGTSIRRAYDALDKAAAAKETGASVDQKHVMNNWRDGEPLMRVKSKVRYH